MLKYTVIRADESGVIQDVSIFNASEYKLAEFVVNTSKRVYPSHKISLEIAFTKTWNHVKDSKRYKDYIAGLSA